MCPQSTIINRPKRMISNDLFHKIINQISPHNNGANVSFHISGEPLLHPSIIEFVRLVSDSDMIARLTTNATLLSRDKSEQLIKAGLKIIEFSFEGMNKELYEATRVGACYEQTMENIEYFLNINDGKVFTELVCVDLPNIEVAIISEFLTTMAPKFDNINRSGYFDWLGKMNSVGFDKTHYIGCNAFNDLNILSDGRVVACCMDVDGQLIVGDFNTMNYSEIMASTSRKNLKDKIDNAKLDGLPCQNCQVPWGGRRVRPS